MTTEPEVDAVGLLPCPFCGHEAGGFLHKIKGNEPVPDTWQVICGGSPKCAAVVPFFPVRTKAEAIAAWNRRAQPDTRAVLARPLDQWSEEHGDVVWWCWRNGAWLGEPAYIGTPLDLGQSIEIELRSNQGEFIHAHQVGGWPGYHTHWTPHPDVPPAIKENDNGQ